MVCSKLAQHKNLGRQMDQPQWRQHHLDYQTKLHYQDLINPSNNCWNEQIITHNFFHIEASRILQIPLDITMNEDTIRWQGTKDGNHIVKSG
jgi:hypothetical protein